VATHGPGGGVAIGPNRRGAANPRKLDPLRLALLLLPLLCAPSALDAHADSILVLNQQSYPEVGGLWTVQFEAWGTHDLTVSGAEGTTVGAGGDVSFVGLRDGAGRYVAPAHDGGRLIFAVYEGGGTSELTVRVNTPGPHALLLAFGGDEALARNNAYPRQVTEIAASVGGEPFLKRLDNFGRSVAKIGDLDGDGTADLAVGTWGRDPAVHILLLTSTGTAKQATRIDSSTPNGPQLATTDGFGVSLAAVGDLDGDGTPDLAVGANGADRVRGAVHLLFMNSDGTVKNTVEINDSTANGPQLARNDNFGVSLAAVGDLDGDGNMDLAVGAGGDDAGGTNAGAVHLLLLNSTGTVRQTAEINASTPNGPSLGVNTRFGSSLAAMGDLDGDGVGDMAGTVDGTAISVLFLNSDGTVKRTTGLPVTSIGSPSLAAVGDLDGDGMTELAVGVTGDDTGGTNAGAAYLSFLDSDLGIKRTVKIDASTENGPQLEAGDRFSWSLAAVGDLDGDGTADLAVGAVGDDGRAAGTGAVHMLFLNSDGTVKRTSPIDGSHPYELSLARDDNFGSSLAAVGDLDGDGTVDLAVGAEGDDAGGTNAGAVHLMYYSDGTVRQTVKIDGSTANGPQLAANDNFGSSLAALGDLERDGTADLAVGAPGDGGNKGAVHLLLLTSTGTVRQTVKIDDSTANGPQLAANDAFGSSLAAVGDLDRDGNMDLAVGSAFDDAGADDAGAVHLLLLTSTGTVKQTSEINASTPNGPQLASGDAFGSSLAAVGDLDRDGTADLAVGAPFDDAGAPNAGVVHIVRLGATAPSWDGTMSSFAELGGLKLLDGDAFGSSLASVDLDGDGIQDLAVGAINESVGTETTGAVHLLFMNADGSVERTAQIDGSTPNGPQLTAGDNFGSSLAAVDLDGDGTADLAVGATDDDAGGTNKGAVHLLFMNSDGSVKRTVEINDSTANGPQLTEYDNFGGSVAAVGDIDGDGTPDLAAGAIFDTSDILSEGAVHLLFMNSDGTVKSTAEINSTNGPQLELSDHFGSSLAAVGDLNRDGTPDLAAGAFFTYDEIRNENIGAVHIMLLSSTGTVKQSTKIDASTPNGPSLANGDLFGSSLAAVGDLDGDGAVDLATGAPGNARGAVHIMLLTSTGTVKQSTKIDASTPNGPSLTNGYRFGSSLAAVGDLDGDGTADLAAGASGVNTQGVSVAGAVHLLLLTSTGTVKQSTEIEASNIGSQPPVARGDRFGSSLAAVGDINRDGIGDMAVGAPGDDEGATNAGAVHLLLLTSTGTAKQDVKIDASTANGPQLVAHDEFGSSLAAVGDLDGDGTADLAAGAPGHPTKPGAAHLLFMNSDGTVKRTATIDSSTANGPQLTAGDNFGSSLAAVGDLDRDGTADLAVGSTGRHGAVHLLFMNADGTVKRTAKIDSSTANGPQLTAGDNFGSSLATVGDLDRNGTVDLAVGAPRTTAGAQYVGDVVSNSAGAVHLLYLNSDGTVKRTAKISSSAITGLRLEQNYLFGSSVSAAGDLDRNGVPDLVVGAPGAGSAGSAYVVLLNTGRLVKDTYVVDGTALQGIGLGASFGSAVAGAWDLDGNGAAEIAVGASGYNSRGTVRIMSEFRPAFVTGVGSPNADGTYGQGSPIDIDVEFSEPVHVTGAPALLLETGVTDRHAAYVSGSGTGTLRFRYVVQYGDSSPDLRYVGQSSLLPMGGAIGASNKTTVLGLPVPGMPQSLSFAKNLHIDGIRPVLEGASPRLQLALGVLMLDFDKPIDVSALDAGGITIRGQSYSTQLTGATIQGSDTDRPVLRLTSDQASALRQASGPLTVTISGSAFADTAGNYFAGTADAQLDVQLTLVSSVSSADNVVLSDSARAVTSGSDPSDSPVIFDSARVHDPRFAPSDSPSFSDSAAHLGSLTSSSTDASMLSDSARAFKSAFAASGAPILSDSVQWGSARTASGSDSPVLSDSALARLSSVAESDSPALSDSARAGVSARLLRDSPALSDSAATGQPRPPVSAGDAPSVSDGAAYESAAPAPAPTPAPTPAGGGADPARVSGGGPARGSGGVGIALAVIHSVSYDRCSDEPHVSVTASPPGGIAVTLERAGAVTTAHPTGQRAGAPDSAVWEASISSDARSLHVRAANQASSDSQRLDMDSCSGFVRFTAFGAPAAATSASGAQQAGRDLEPEDAGPPAGPTDEPAPTPYSEPVSERPPEPAAGPTDEPAPLRDEPAPDPPAVAQNAETATGEGRAAPDLTSEPRAAAPARAEPAANDVWYAAAAAAAAGAALLAAIVAKRRSRSGRL